jgi:hypothetical protein
MAFGASTAMSIMGDPSKPLGPTPPHVGLSQVTFDRQTMQISEMDSDVRISDDDNYSKYKNSLTIFNLVKQTLDHFYPVNGPAQEAKLAKVQQE